MYVVDCGPQNVLYAAVTVCFAIFKIVWRYIFLFLYFYVVFVCFRRCKIYTYKRVLFIFNIFTVSLYYAWPLLTRLLSNQHQHGKSFFKKIDGLGTYQRHTNTHSEMNKIDRNIAARNEKENIEEWRAYSHADSTNPFPRIHAKHVIYICRAHHILGMGIHGSLSHRIRYISNIIQPEHFVPSVYITVQDSQ